MLVTLFNVVLDCLLHHLKCFSYSNQCAEIMGWLRTEPLAILQIMRVGESFLKYGNALKVVRAGNSALLNAVAGTHEVLNGGIEGIALNSVPTYCKGRRDPVCVCSNHIYPESA